MARASYGSKNRHKKKKRFNYEYLKNKPWWVYLFISILVLFFELIKMGLFWLFYINIKTRKQTYR